MIDLDHLEAGRPGGEGAQDPGCPVVRPVIDGDNLEPAFGYALAKQVLHAPLGEALGVVHRDYDA